jgi:Holliday junction DNA helicase RuvA
MIAYLKGKIILRGLNFAVVETSNVGYKVFVPNDFPPSGETEVFTYHHVREDINDLYGFKSAKLLAVFEMLIGVSGIGPKVAMNIVSNLGVEVILNGISRNDPSIFKSVSGVGSKAAAKIIVELKSKVVGGAQIDQMPREDETVEALISLGYRKHEIYPILKMIPPDITDLQQKVRFVLKNVGKNKSSKTS